MNPRPAFNPFFILIFFYISYSSVIRTEGQEIGALTNNLIQVVNSHHLEPQVVDDIFSERVFTGFLDLLDPDRSYFTQRDSISLLEFRHQVDDQINSGDFSPLKTVTDLYKQRVIAAQSFADSILQRPLNYSTPEKSNAMVSNEKNFSKDYASLKKRRIRVLKQKILMRAWRMSLAKNADLTIASFPALEVLAREKVKTRSHHATENILRHADGFDRHVENLFLKAISLSFDPHTEYFTPAEMKEFETALRTSGLSFGLDLHESQTGEVAILRLSPGGPAWKSEEIKQGDVLLSIKYNAAPAVEVADFEIDEIIEQLNDMRFLQADITVKKPDGSLKTVSLRKEKIENIENLISSFVVEESRKVGYIALPGFYTDEKDQSGRGCAGDVAKEIIKLKREGIEGLILDLRFNGGGSVQEAIDLTGIFVDVGAVAIIEQKGEGFITLKDGNRGSVYDGPLVVMINSFSASASELVAAALQDYNRAIIVGCTSFGKATGQIIFPLSVGKGEVNQAGFVKVTEDRLYRVTGNSLQLIGVVPEITFPEITEVLGQKESSYQNPLKPKNISKKAYYTPWPVIPGKELREASTKRTTSSQYFQSIDKLGITLRTPVPIDVKTFIQFMEEINDLSFKLSNDALDSGNYKVYSSGLDKSLLAVDSYHREISNNAIQEIKGSAYVREAYDIIDDFLKLKKSKP